ncbi:hypothetical protein ACOBV8_19735 (plasmid) [Pseudoalteromonas espejiana]
MEAQNGDLPNPNIKGFITLKGQKQSIFEIGLLHRYEIITILFITKNIGFVYTGLNLSNIWLSFYGEYGSRIDYANEQIGDSYATQTQAKWDINDHWH